MTLNSCKYSYLLTSLWNSKRKQYDRRIEQTHITDLLDSKQVTQEEDRVFDCKQIESYHFPETVIHVVPPLQRSYEPYY